MIGTCLLLSLALLLASGDADAPALIARLGSADPAERAAATRALESMGRPALTPLADACRSTDAAVRDRALNAWKVVQRGVLLQPTLLRITTPLTSETLVRLAAEQGGMMVETPNQRNLPNQLAEPVSFWTAVDRLGLQGPHLHQREPDGGKFPVLLFQPITSRYPTSTRGSFRVTLQSLHEHRDTSLVPGPWVRIDSMNQRIGIPRETPAQHLRLYAELEVMAEPRMWFTQEGSARAIEAVDDLGQSLIRPAEAPVEADYSVSSNAGGVVGGLVRLDFAVPAQAGRRIVRLRGRVPLALLVRYSVPDFDLKLADVTGQTFASSLGSFTVNGMDPAGSSMATLAVKLDPAGNDCPETGESQLLSARVNCLFKHQIEFVDAEGVVLSGAGGGGWGPSGSGQMHYNFGVGPAKDRPDRLRIYRMLRVFTDVDFEFADIPLP